MLEDDGDGNGNYLVHPNFPTPTKPCFATLRPEPQTLNPKTLSYKLSKPCRYVETCVNDRAGDVSNHGAEAFGA